MILKLLYIDFSGDNEMNEEIFKVKVGTHQRVVGFGLQGIHQILRCLTSQISLVARTLQTVSFLQGF